MNRCDTAASNLILLAPLFTTTIANSQTFISRKSIPEHSVCRKHNMKLSQSAFFPNKGSVSRDFYLLFYSSVSNLLGPLLKRFTYVPVLWIRIRLQEFANLLIFFSQKHFYELNKVLKNCKQKTSLPGNQGCRSCPFLKFPAPASAPDKFRLRLLLLPLPLVIVIVIVRVP